MKKCTKCKIEKELTEFNKDRRAKSGLQSKCKYCDKEYREANKERAKERNKKYYKANKERNKEYYKANKEKIKERYKEYRQANKEYYKEYCKEYYQSNKEKISKKNKEYAEINKDRIRVKQKEWRESNKEKIKERKRKYYEKNKEKTKKRVKKYRIANGDKINEYRKKNKKRINQRYRKYIARKRETDDLFKMKQSLRSRTSKAFIRKGYSKNTKTQEMLGVDWEVCKAHIERQFTKGMNWDNYGEWHIDHIIPLASANDEAELKKLCHYSNLQPLWAEENLSKSDKIAGQQNKLRL